MNNFDPAAASRRIAHLEGEIQTLERQLRQANSTIDEQNGTIVTIREQLADRNELAENLNAEIRRLTRELSELRSTLQGRDGTVRELRTQVDALQQRLDELTPDEVAQRRIEAMRLETEEAELIAAKSARAQKISNVVRSVGMGVLAAVLTAIVFGVVTALGFKPETFTIVLTSVIVGLLAGLAPAIQAALAIIKPHVIAYWRPLTIIASLGAGGITASLGIAKGAAGWVSFLTWTGVTIGFGIVFQSIAESVGFLYREFKKPESAAWKVYAVSGYLLSSVIGILSAIIADKPIISIIDFPGASPALFLFNWLVMTLCSFGGTGLSAFLAWLTLKLFGNMGVKFLADTAASFRTLFTKSVDEQKKEDSSEKWARFAVLFLSILVSTLMIISLFPNTKNGGWTWNKGLAFGFGIGLATVYWILETLLLRAALNPKTGDKRFSSLRRWGIFVASLSVFLSFGKILALASYNDRVADVRHEVSVAAGEYLGTVEKKARQKAEISDTKEMAQKYLGAIEDMKAGLDQIRTAGSFEELDIAAEQFKVAGRTVKDCLPVTADKGLLERVTAPSEPGHTEIAIQVLTQKPIPGSPRVYWGSVGFALPATAFADFAAVILALALRSWKRKYDDEEEEPKLEEKKEDPKKEAVAA